MMKVRKNNQGFTLIELMVSVVIIVILTSVALPTYQNHIDASRRSEGVSFLLHIASMQERYYTHENRYATTEELITLLGLDPTNGDTLQSQMEFYTVSSSSDANFVTYTLTATVNAGKWTDADCGDLTLSNTGVRDAKATSADVDACWS